MGGAIVRRWLAAAAVAATAACSAVGPPAGPRDRGPALSGPGRARVEALMEAAGIPGLAAARLLPAGEVELVALGVTDSRGGAPVTPDTGFATPIVADPLLACATLRLAARGALDPGSPAGATSPLAVLARESAPTEPRGSILRPAAGADGLARQLEQTTGGPLPALLDAEVLRPLAMTRTRLAGPDSATDIATGHDLLGDPVRPTDQPPGPVTTVDDLARLVRELLAPSHLGRAVVADMLAPRTPLADRVAWGLGVGLEHDDGSWGFWLAGQGDGFSCLLAGSPSRGRGAVVLTNSDTGLAIAAEVLTELVGGDHPALAWLPVERWDQPAFLIRRRLVGAAVRDGLAEVGAQLSELELAYGRLELSEALLNRVGYDLLGRGLAREAVVVLRRNAELYPQSWNVHDSLGEALAAAGDAGAAAASYRRSLELNPDNENARRSLELLDSP